MGVQLESAGCWPVCLRVGFIQTLKNNRFTALFHRSKTEANPTNHLPVELWKIVFSHCEDLLILRKVSRLWCQVIQNPTFFETKYKLPIHPIAIAIITRSNLRIDSDCQLSLQYVTLGPHGRTLESTLIFKKEEKGIQLEDEHGVMSPEQLSEGYYLSPFTVLQKACFFNEDEKTYLLNLVTGKKCRLLRAQRTNAFGPEEYFTQSKKITL